MSDKWVIDMSGEESMERNVPQSPIFIHVTAVPPILIILTVTKLGYASLALIIEHGRHEENKPSNSAWDSELDKLLHNTIIISGFNEGREFNYNRLSKLRGNMDDNNTACDTSKQIANECKIVSSGEEWILELVAHSRHPDETVHISKADQGTEIPFMLLYDLPVRG